MSHQGAVEERKKERKKIQKERDSRVKGLNVQLVKQIRFKSEKLEWNESSFWDQKVSNLHNIVLLAMKQKHAEKLPLRLKKKKKK